MSLFSCLGGKRPPHQIVMLGLQDAGKTTLLYKLKFGDKLTGEWKEIHKFVKALKGEQKQEDEQDVSLYHYEELTSKAMKSYGLWDVPGSLCATWATFYRYIPITATIFVVNASEKSADDEKMLRDSRRMLNYLLYEDELRQAAFVVVINEYLDKEVGKGKKKKKEKTKKKRAKSSGSSASLDTEEGANGTGTPRQSTVAAQKIEAPSISSAAAHVVLEKHAKPDVALTPHGEAVAEKLGLKKLQQEDGLRQRLLCVYLDVTEPKQRWDYVTDQIHKINIIIGNEA